MEVPELSMLGLVQTRAKWEEEFAPQDGDPMEVEKEPEDGGLVSKRRLVEFRPNPPSSDVPPDSLELSINAESCPAPALMVIGSVFGTESGSCVSLAVMGIVSDYGKDSGVLVTNEERGGYVAGKVEQVLENVLVKGENVMDNVVVSRVGAAIEDPIGGPVDGPIGSIEGREVEKFVVESPISGGRHMRADVSPISHRPNGKVGGRGLACRKKGFLVGGRTRKEKKGGCSSKMISQSPERALERSSVMGPVSTHHA